MTILFKWSDGIKNHHHGSGKAIGRGFIRTVTYGQIKHNRNLRFGISPDVFDDDDIFVQFSEVVPMDQNEACLICELSYFPAVFASWYNMTDDEKRTSVGGFRFFQLADGGRKKRRRKRKSRRRRNTRKRRRKKTKKRRRKKRTKRRK